MNYLSHFGEKTVHPITEGLIERFIQNASMYPDHPAIITPQETVSYHQLAQQSHALAIHLRQKGIEKETPVAVLFEPSIEQIICQLAILEAGGSCVPLDPAMPDDRLNFMLQDLQITLIISNKKSQGRALSAPIITLEPALLSTVDIPYLPASPQGSTHRTHVLFTSGTTGRPKSVEIEARGVINLVVNTNHIRFQQTDKIACIASPTFDASLFEVWGALLNGASLVIFPKKTVVDPYQFEEVLQRFSIDIMLITSALFNVIANICPRAFRSLRYLLVGGEALTSYTLRQVKQNAPPQHMLNCYGPTEGTTFALTHEISLDDVMEDNVPIGKPIDNTDVFILDDKLQLVGPETIGQIYIGGEGLARGYWNRSALNAERFIVADINQDNHLRRLYYTGDLGWQRADGVFMYAGRIDNQIKIRGYRIEVEEIEAQLLESQLLQSTVVCVIKKENTEPYLVAFMVPTSSGEYSKAKMKEWLAKKLPDYMHPRQSLVESLPLTLNGKVDRAQLIADFLVSSRPSAPPLAGNDQAELSSIVLNIWRQVLDDHDITLDDDFFRSGGNSLQAASLIVDIGRKIGRRLAVQNLYDAPTPRSLIQLLQINKQEPEDICAVLLKEATLPDDIQPLPHPLQDWFTPASGRVLLTGATGFLGAFLLRDLLLQEEVRRVICLVRASDNGSALERVKNNLQQYGLWQEGFLLRLEVLASDLAEPSFALDPRVYERLSTECDVIFHLAAHVNYIQPYSAHYSGNISATVNVLRFAVRAKVKPLHYVSTIAVFGPAGLLSPRVRVYENDDILPYLDGLKYDSGYSQSQWVVERIVMQARERGVPVAVYRPGFIMGDSVSGAGNPKDFVGRLIKGCVRIGAYLQLPNQRKEFIPVNYVSRALLSIASDNANLGDVYHLVPPDNTQSTDLNSFFELLKQSGFHLQAVSYPEWILRLEADENIIDNPLSYRRWSMGNSPAGRYMKTCQLMTHRIHSLR